ncbi:hypothetical protein Tco_1439899 [Tanacetum coccineum]
MESIKKSIVERAKHKREYDSRMNDQQMQSKEKKKLQILEVLSNTVHELKVVSVIMENTCSRKENANSEAASSKTVKESSFDSATKEVDSSEALDVSLVVIECSETKSEKHVTRSRYGNDTHAADENMKPVNDKEPMAEVDSNTTLDSTNISHTGGEIDQDAEHPFLNAELIKKKDMVQTEVYNELSNRFLQLENHCISLEISIQQKEESSFQSNKPFVRQLNAFTSEQPRISRPRFASKVDEKTDLSKTVTSHYLPKVRESAPTKPHHVNYDTSILTNIAAEANLGYYFIVQQS